MLEVLVAPFVACLLLAGIHCYLGLHVLMREVIFVDLALAQIAALGVAAGAIAGAVPHTGSSYAWAVGATLVGAGVFAFARFEHRHVSQEAVIGITYAVSTAVTVLLLAHSAVDRDEIEHMLIGRLLFVDWPEIASMAVVYAGVGAVHAVCARPFLAISRRETAGMAEGRRRWWDFLFYATFGVVVAGSVQMAGVLLVFTFLVVPAACASLLGGSTLRRLLVGWAFGVAGSVGGLSLSAGLDLPTGAAVVAVFGMLFLGTGLLSLCLRPRR